MRLIIAICATLAGLAALAELPPPWTADAPGWQATETGVRFDYDGASNQPYAVANYGEPVQLPVSVRCRMTVGPGLTHRCGVQVGPYQLLIYAHHLLILNYNESFAWQWALPQDQTFLQGKNIGLDVEENGYVTVWLDGLPVRGHEGIGTDIANPIQVALIAERKQHAWGTHFSVSNWSVTSGAAEGEGEGEGEGEPTPQPELNQVIDALRTLKRFWESL